MTYSVAALLSCLQGYRFSPLNDASPTNIKVFLVIHRPVGDPHIKRTLPIYATHHYPSMLSDEKKRCESKLSSENNRVTMVRPLIQISGSLCAS